MPRSTMRKPAKAKPTGANPFALREPKEAKKEVEPFAHVMKGGIRCDTEQRGHQTARGRSRLEIVLDASEGFIPLWAKGMTLRWRFRESSLRHFENPEAAKATIEQLFGEAILLWGNAAPIKFAKRDDAWDFEIAVSEADNCNPMGCTLARAFFPDAGRHDLAIYPKMFTQDREEQVETLTHEIGHIFGLRHFFAQIKETQWPSEIFGAHKKFSIMNYGADSELSAADKADLKRLYESAWAGQLTEVNGTPIRLVKPFHTIGDPADNVVAGGQTPTVFQPRQRRRRR